MNICQHTKVKKKKGKEKKHSFFSQAASVNVMFHEEPRYRGLRPKKNQKSFIFIYILRYWGTIFVEEPMIIA